GAWVARRVSKTEKRGREPLHVQEARARHLESWAVDHLQANPELDLVVLGHTHIPLLREVEPGRHYLNAGDWVLRESYAVIIPGESPRLLDWGSEG
ncbi:hypothetical protein ACFL5A_03655, partial [Gemmatimonadota bacterium]